MNSFQVFIAALFLFCSYCSCTERILRHGFGESCNDTIMCEKRSLLTCQNSTCTCVLPDSMVFDSTKQKCVSKVGERCKFELADRSNNSDTISLYEISSCVNNASCANDGVCECDSEFYETAEGNCISKGSFNETCSSDTECRVNKHLNCFEGYCTCNANYSLWNSIKEECVGKAGVVLTKIEFCTDGAKMNDQGICICQPETQKYAGLDGQCYTKKPRNSSCNLDEECIYFYRYLSCVNGTCDCDPGLHKWRYDIPGSYIRSNWDFHLGISQNDGQCVGLAGKPSNQENRCVEGAERGSWRTSNENCTCLSGIPTKRGTCGYIHGSTCLLSEDCSDHLICDNGNCKCPDKKHQVYNAQSQRCESIVGGPCKNGPDCIRNSECEYYEPEYGYKQCRCKPGFVETRGGICQPGYGTACNYISEHHYYVGPEKCDTIAGLSCQDRLCKCPNTLSYFDSETRKCLDRVGSRCEESKTCIPNGFCNINPNGIFILGNCECKDGYMVTKEKLCELRPIEFTTNSGIISNPDDFMNELVKNIIL